MAFINNTIVKIYADENGNGRVAVIAEKTVRKVVLDISARYSDRKYRFEFAGEEKR